MVQQFQALLRNPKVHDRVHNSLPLVPNLSQSNQVHATRVYFRRTHLLLGLSNDLVSTLNFCIQLSTTRRMLHSQLSVVPWF